METEDKDKTVAKVASYSAWILGHAAAMLGVVLTVLWAFAFVFLLAQLEIAEAKGVTIPESERWRPPFGPPLAGLATAVVAWLITQVKQIRVPAPVIVALIANGLALAIAMAALVIGP